MSPHLCASLEPTIDQRAQRALARSRRFGADALRLLLRCKELLMLGQALALAEWREMPGDAARSFAEFRQLRLQLGEKGEENRLLRARLARIPGRERKRHTPEERFDVVRFMKTYNLTYRATAQRFVFDESTVSRWHHEVIEQPETTTVGSLIKPSPPIRAYDDVTRSLVQLLDTMKVGGSMTIAQTLARAGRKLGRETVRRWRKRATHPQPIPPIAPDRAPVKANYPNHVWMADVTEVPTLFRIFALKLVVVLDAFSRFPLAFQVFWKEPSGEEIAHLFRAAAEEFGRPKYAVTDRGPQFTSDVFRDALAKLGTKPRYGALGQHGAIAIIERFWRNLKQTLDLKGSPPLGRSHLAERVDLGLFHYATIRPHQGLGGATPAELYFGLTPANALATPPPRRAGPASSPVPFDDLPCAVAYLDRERRLPIVVRRDRPPTAHAA